MIISETQGHFSPMPITYIITSYKFQSFAGNRQEIWKFLLDCRVVHRVYGMGTATSVDPKENIELTVTFNLKGGGTKELGFLTPGSMCIFAVSCSLKTSKSIYQYP